MNTNPKTYRGLADISGWLSVATFILGALSAVSGRYLLLSGNDYWQASLYLALFAIFASYRARE